MPKWDDAKEQALKILGKDAEVPDMPDTVEQAADKMDKNTDELDKAREDCEAKVLALQNDNDSVRNAVKQFLAKIEKSDFKLDPKKKEDVEKIQKARKLLSGVLNAGIKSREQEAKSLDELDKHLIQLSKYKPTPTQI